MSIPTPYEHPDLDVWGVMEDAERMIAATRDEQPTMNMVRSIALGAALTEFFAGVVRATSISSEDADDIAIAITRRFDRIHRRAQRAESETARVRREAIGQRKRADYWRGWAKAHGWCADCEHGIYPHYGGAPGRDGIRFVDGRPVFAQSEPDPRETWPANFREDPDCPGLGTWTCPTCTVKP